MPLREYLSICRRVAFVRFNTAEMNSKDDASRIAHADPAGNPRRTWARRRSAQSRAGRTAVLAVAALAVVAVVVVLVMDPLSSESAKNAESQAGEGTSNAVADANDGANPATASPPNESPAAVAQDGAQQDAGGNRRIAVAHSQQKEWPQAAAAWRKVIAQNPNDAAARMALAKSLEALKQPRRAWAQYRRAVELDDSLLEAHQRLGHLSASGNQWAHAAQHFGKMAQALPNDFRPRFNLGMALAQDEKWQGATKQFREVLRLKPEMSQAREYIHKGERALADYEQIRKAEHAKGNTAGPLEVLSDGFVGSDACRDCHKQNYDTWQGSYHSTMTQEAHSNMAMASFDEVDLHYNGASYRLRQHDGELWIETREKKAGEESLVNLGVDTSLDEEDDLKWRKVAVTTGSHHMQAYWMGSGLGRALELFPLVYLREEARWVPFTSIFLVPPSEPGQPQAGQWNYICSRCHNTQARPRKLDDGFPDTHVSEFGISCESCHGPGAKHLEATESGLESLAITDPSHLTPKRSSEVCGQCHSSSAHKSEGHLAEWMEHGFAFRPGDKFEDHRRIVKTGETQFWNDGMIRVSGREYNGMLESPCHTHGDAATQMSCISCHELHQSKDDPRPIGEWANDLLKLEMDSNRPGRENNQACTQCHQEYQDDTFLAKHTHHDVASTGSQCYNCHMPHTTWGVRKAMRSHTISSPSVKESLSPIERPNACNLCHVDQTLQWTSEHLASWYDQDKPELTDDQKNVSAAVMWALTGDAGQRALAAWTMGWGPAQDASGTEWMPPFVLQLMGDPYDVVRSTAYQSLQTLEGYEAVKYDYVGPLRPRQQTTAKLLEAWKKRPGAQSSGKQVLNDEKGQLLWDDFKRLYELRDRSPMQLLE